MSLRLTGGRTVQADRHAVWAALHDVTCLQSCIPRCRSLERVSQTRYDLSVLIPFGPVSVPFAGTVESDDSDPFHAMTLRASGDGGLAGLAAGTAHLTLADEPSGCRLAYIVDIDPTGPFAFMGMWILAGVARSLVEQFGTRFATTVEAQALLAQAGRTEPLRTSTMSTSV